MLCVRALSKLLVLIVVLPTLICAKLTSETFEQVFNVGGGSGNGGSLHGAITVGWSLLSSVSPISISFTVVSPSLTSGGWLGVGFSQGAGLGVSLMSNGGAVIARPQTLTGIILGEYQLVNPAIGVAPWSTSGPNEAQIASCLSSYCSNQIGQCQSDPMCSSSISCVKQQLSTLNTTTLTVNTISSSDNAALNEFLACGKNLSAGGLSPTSNKALSYLLNGASCFIANCAESLSAESLRPPGTFNMQVTQNPSSGTTMTFISNGTVGGIPLSVTPGVPMTLMVAFGPSNNAFSHDSSSRQAISIDLTTGIIMKQASPDWVTLHAAIMTAGLGVALPVGAILRAYGMYGGSTLILMGIVTGIIGVALVSVHIPSIVSNDIHAILGIITIVLVCFLPFILLARPMKSGLVFDEATKRFISNADEVVIRLRLYHTSVTSMELLVIGLGVVVSFLGLTAVDNSLVSTVP